MNVVANEFVAARDDEQGVLILSDFGGVSRELSEALIVNPYDVYSVVESVGQALLMSVVDRRERIRLMRDVVRSRNVYRWAGRMLLDASQLRKRHKVMLMGSQEPKDALIRGRFDKLREIRRLDYSCGQEVDALASASNHTGSGVREQRRSVSHWTTSESESHGARSKGRAIS
jgi:Glycosyltransferase family 20